MLEAGKESFTIRNPDFAEQSSHAVIVQGPDELTLREEECGAQKSCINLEHIADDKWEPPLVDADWHAFFQRY